MKTPSADSTDADLAAALAHLAGATLLTTREELGAAGVTGKALGKAGDVAAQKVIAKALEGSRPGDAVLSEEAPDDPSRLSAERVWIVDPLDGTKHFAEGKNEWAVHIALWEQGHLTVGAVALPTEGVVLRSDEVGAPSSTAGKPLRIAVSSSRTPPIAREAAQSLSATLVPMGSAGVKIASVIRGQNDAYIHAGGQYEWDSAAPIALARAAGLHTSRLDGSDLLYNRKDPYLPDLVVTRAEIADKVTAAIARAI